MGFQLAEKVEIWKGAEEKQPPGLKPLLILLASCGVKTLAYLRFEFFRKQNARTLQKFPY